MNAKSDKGTAIEGLADGITDHDTLVTTIEPIKDLVVAKTVSNIWGLLLSGDEMRCRSFSRIPNPTTLTLRTGRPASRSYLGVLHQQTRTELRISMSVTVIFEEAAF